MKKLRLFVAIAVIALLASCGKEDKNTTTLDLSNPTTPASFEFTRNIWDGTYSSDIPYIVCQAFSFQHFGSTEFGGYYMGFTVSNEATADAANPESSITKGGLAGEGKPYLINYWGDYYMGDVYYRTSDIIFDGAYTPKQVYVANTAMVVECIKNGLAQGARAFVSGDYFSLEIIALDEKHNPIDGNSVTYYLADYRDGKSFINTSWEKVDLSSLGTCYGLTFKMVTTDMVSYDGTSYYAQTPTYFALDGLSVKK